MHVVNKGKAGEREVVNIIKGVFRELSEEDNHSLEVSTKLQEVVQRNQNQSAVGGGDINIFGISIEVKRQQTLAIDTWWKQTVKSAERNDDTPVLIYRQNNKKWKAVLIGCIPMAGNPNMQMHTRVEMNLDSFKQWIKISVKSKIDRGYFERV